MPKAKVQHNGQEIEVEISDEQVAEWGYVSKSDLNEKYVPKNNVEATIQQRVSRAKQDAKTALMEDDDFAREILEGRGVPLDEEGNVKMPEGGLSAEEVQAQLNEKRGLWEEQWKKKHNQPLQSKLDETIGENETLRKQILVADIIRAARAANVAADKFETLPGAPIETAPVIQQTMSRFAWAPDAKRWALKNGTDAEGNPTFELHPDADADTPYADASVLFSKLKEDKKTPKGWFEETRMKNTGVGNAGPGAGAEKGYSDLSDSELSQQLEKELL